MNKYIILLLMLSGCASPMDYAVQDYVCRDNGGVYRYTKFPNNINDSCLCMDSTIKKFYSVDVQITEDFYPNNDNQL